MSGHHDDSPFAVQQEHPQGQSHSNPAIGSPSAEPGSTAQPGPAKAPEKSTKKSLLDLTKYRGSNTASAEGDTSVGIQTNIPVKKPGRKTSSAFTLTRVIASTTLG